MGASRHGVYKHVGRPPLDPKRPFTCRHCNAQKPAEERVQKNLNTCRGCANDARREKRLRKKATDPKKFDKRERDKKLYLDFEKRPSKNNAPRGVASVIDETCEDDFASEDRLSIDDLKFLL